MLLLLFTAESFKEGLFLPVARRNKEKETSDASRIRVCAVGSSAVWGNSVIYSPVKFILFNNPGGFCLACSDTVLGKGKNQTPLHYSPSCDFCHMPWNNTACSSAPSLESRFCALAWGRVCSLRGQRLPPATGCHGAATPSPRVATLSRRPSRGHLCPCGVSIPQHGEAGDGAGGPCLSRDVSGSSPGSEQTAEP